MSVFLRWGVFGILAVAALLYAYNASKRLAENRGATPSPTDSAAAPAREVLIPVPEKCEIELRVAERALEARRNQEPLDKLFRNRLIAFENDRARRARLEKVAADWYLLEGEEPSEAALRREVVADCESVTPGP
jgi:hypothetical protein